MTSLPAVCILAGGLGSRLGEHVARTPKPLIEVAGKPFLLHQIRQLADQRVREIVLCVGYLGELIEERIGAQQFGVSIRYSYDAPGLEGTLGAICRARPLLPERFLFLYGDAYLRLDYRAAFEAWKQSDALGLMAVFENRGRWGSSNVVYSDNSILAYDKARPTPEMRWIDYGLGGLTGKALDLASAGERDLAALQSRLAERGELFGYEVTERFYEIGTPEALAEADAFLDGLTSCR